MKKNLNNDFNIVSVIPLEQFLNSAQLFSMAVTPCSVSDYYVVLKQKLNDKQFVFSLCDKTIF